MRPPGSASPPRSPLEGVVSQRNPARGTESFAIAHAVGTTAIAAAPDARFLQRTPAQ